MELFLPHHRTIRFTFQKTLFEDSLPKCKEGVPHLIRILMKINVVIPFPVNMVADVSKSRKLAGQFQYITTLCSVTGGKVDTAAQIGCNIPGDGRIAQGCAGAVDKDTGALIGRITLNIAVCNCGVCCFVPEVDAAASVCGGVALKVQTLDNTVAAFNNDTAAIVGRRVAGDQCVGTDDRTVFTANADGTAAQIVVLFL